MPMTDLRDETTARAPSQVPSPNLAKIRDAVETGELAPLFKLAHKIEEGNATGDEAESLTVYEGLPVLVAYVADLYGMCRRREQALAECGVSVGR